MKRISLSCRGIFTLAVLLTFHNAAQAGSNDLFRSQVSWKCVATGSAGSVSSHSLKLQVTNPRLMNLALGNAVNAPLSSHYKLGLQCNCSNLMMNVVIYDTTTMETVLTVADIPTTSYQSNGKVATVTSSGTIRTNGFLLGGQLTARLVLRLDGDQCAKKAAMSATGTVEIETTDGPVSMNLERGTLRTSGRQLRPVTQAGSGNYGSGGTANSGGVSITIIYVPPSGSFSSAVSVLSVASNVVVGFPSVQLDATPGCNGAIPVSVDQTVSYPFDLTLCSNSVIDLNSGSVLNVCTNGATADTLNFLVSAVSGGGILNLTNCPSTTSP